MGSVYQSNCNRTITIFFSSSFLSLVPPEMPFNLAHNTHIETLQPADREEVNDADADIEMDDDDSFPRSKLTSPGDVIASSSAYMQWVLSGSSAYTRSQPAADTAHMFTTITSFPTCSAQ